MGLILGECKKQRERHFDYGNEIQPIADWPMRLEPETDRILTETV
jgi:hypothetical protein